MGLIELIIVVLVVMWLLGYFGRGRVYARGPILSPSSGWSNYNLIHLILVLAVILLILRLLRIG